MILEYGRRSIGFSLPIIKEWFASQSLVDNPSIFEKIICNPQNLENWYYPLTIIMATCSHEIVSRFLIPIAHQYPAFAARIIRGGSCSSLHSSEHRSLPSPEQCGYQIREAMQAWIEGFGKLSKLIAPIDENGQLQPLGINRLNGVKLEAGWYIGNEKKADVHHLPPGWMHPPSLKRQWVGGISSPGAESAWAWRWTIEKLLRRLKDKLQFLILQIENEAIGQELAWQASLAVMEYQNPWRFSKNEAHKSGYLFLADVEVGLHKIEQDARENNYLPHFVSSQPYSTQNLYLENLKREVSYQKDLGSCYLRNPWLHVNMANGSPEELLIRTQQIYKAALDSYQKLAHTWFNSLIPEMSIAASLPARLVGTIETSHSDEQELFKRVYHLWRLEALPYTDSNLVEFSLNKGQLFEIDNSQNLGNADQRLREFRSDWFIWLKRSPTGGGGLSKDFFGTTPVTDLVSSWLKRDLERIFGFSSLSRFARLG